MSSNKFITFVAGVKTWVTAIATSAGATDASKILMTDSTGKIDASFMPVGIGADTQIIAATEALTAGAFVNITATGVRLADASNGRAAHGFVLSAVANAANATVYRSGRNTGMTGLTVGTRYWLGTAGGVTTTAPTAQNSIIQSIGVAGTATSINFDFDEPTTIA